jgi:hypothetical protein
VAVEPSEREAMPLEDVIQAAAVQARPFQQHGGALASFGGSRLGHEVEGDPRMCSSWAEYPRDEAQQVDAPQAVPDDPANARKSGSGRRCACANTRSRASFLTTPG